MPSPAWICYLGFSKTTTPGVGDLGLGGRAGALVEGGEGEERVGYLAAELNVLLCDALHGHGGRGVEAAQLLHEPGHELWVIYELLALLGVPQELDNTLLLISLPFPLHRQRKRKIKVGLATYQVDHVHHGRVSCDEQEERNLHGVLLAEGPLAQLLHAELADEVVLGLLRARVYEAGEVVEELPGVCQRLLHAREYGLGTWVGRTRLRTAPRGPWSSRLCGRRFGS